MNPLSRRKPLSLKSLSDGDLIQNLHSLHPDYRHTAFAELCERGEKWGWRAFALLTMDPTLSSLFLSLKDPFDAIGVGVRPDTYEKIKTQWPQALEKISDMGHHQLTIDFRHERLDVMVLPSLGGEIRGTEGLCEIEFEVKDVSAFTRRLEELPSTEGKSRLRLLPGGLRQVGAESRFLLAHVPSPRGARTILVQLVERKAD